jgi:DNA polymerase-2
LTDSTEIFLLTDEWEDTGGKNVLRFYGSSPVDGPVLVIINNFKPVFFINSDSLIPDLPVPHLRRNVKMKSFAGAGVDAVYFNTYSSMKKAAALFEGQNIATYEADVDPARRFLMERNISARMRVTGKSTKRNNITVFVNPAIEPCEVVPSLSCVSVDIETGKKNTLLYSIAVHLTCSAKEEKAVFIIGSEKNSPENYIRYYEDETSLLTAFIEWLKKSDPDIITGWHVIGFDLMFLEEKCRQLGILFDIARNHGKVYLRSVKGRGHYATIPGRVVIDGPPALRSAFYSFEDFKLETVAQQLLKTGKTITPEQNKIEEIERNFAENKTKLAEYNLQDSVLVSEIFKKTGLVELSIKRSELSGLLIDRLAMMTAAFDHFYLPRLHKAGYVAPNIKDNNPSGHAAGGYVIDPKPGIYEKVIVLDFKSLYPSIIQTFKIDPLSRLESDINSILTPAGYKFSYTEHLLPEFIARLMQLRGEAKKQGDKYLAQAIKILMNSFYGVMGSYNCRFYHPSLPSAITGTGQWLLLQSREYLESNGYFVVYGDTDSLFVRLKDNEGNDPDYTGETIAAGLNNYWKKRLADVFNVISFLEIEYEKYYKKYIITPARGSETGAKKRYAGLKVIKGIEKIEFVGMEFVRSDWTKLAKEFQVELYSRVFSGAEIINWLRGFVKDIKEGLYDDKLVYSKRIRKDVDEYKNVPPQVKAAKLLNETGGTIRYIITKKGPVPVDLEEHPAEIDYQHYIEKQIKPIADSLLALQGTSFDEIILSRQLSFF